MLLEHPHHFGMYYVAFFHVMMALRLYMYAKNKWLYFLLDFCYGSMPLAFVSVMYAPNNATVEIKLCLYQWSLAWSYIGLEEFTCVSFAR